MASKQKKVSSIVVIVAVVAVAGLAIFASGKGKLLTGAFRNINFSNMQRGALGRIRPSDFTKSAPVVPPPPPTPGTVTVSLSPITPQGSYNVAPLQNIAVFNVTTDATTNTNITHFDILLTSNTESINPFFYSGNISLIGDGTDLGGTPTFLTIAPGHIEISYALSAPFTLPAGTTHSLAVTANTMDLMNITPGDDNLLATMTTLYATGATNNTPKSALNLIY